MKKLLISLFALGYIMNIAAANVLEPKVADRDFFYPARSPKNIITQQSPLTRADGNWFGYCYDLYDGVGLGIQGALMEAVIEIPAEQAKIWAGNKVTAVNIGFGQSSNKVVNIYITKDLEGEPVLMQEATILEEKAWNRIELDTPYTIDDDAFYIGYQSVLKRQDDYPIMIDGVFTTLAYGDIIGMFVDGYEDSGYYNMGTQFGSVCLKAEITGDNIPAFGGMVDTVYMDDFAGVDQSFDMVFSIVNTGLTTIAGADVTVTVNDTEISYEKLSILGEASSNEGAPADQLLNDMIPFGTVGFIQIEGLKYSQAGQVPLVVTVNEFQGPDGTSGKSGLSLATMMTFYSTLFDKAFVIEEYTGTWCGYCPRGIVGMTYMEENYANQGFIGIAVHYGPNDPMQCDTYAPLAANYYSYPGFPTCTLNRIDNFDPNKDDFEKTFQEFKGSGSPVKASVTANYPDGSDAVKVEGTAEFAFASEETNFAFAFVLTENNVGPYVQTNYFSGGTGQMYLEGWSDKGANVVTTYNEVARDITELYGIKGSIPAKVSEGTPYSYSVELPISNVSNIDKCHVVALIINTATGEIANAAQTPVRTAGVESLVTEPGDGIYRVYNPQGVKVLETKDASTIESLPKGIYIINGKKVMI